MGQAELLKTIKALRWQLRRFVWLSYALQALMCGAGAMCLWAALDDIFGSRPIWGGLLIVLGYVNGKNFVEAAEDRKKTRQMMAGLDAQIALLTDLPLS